MHTPGPWDRIMHEEKCSRVGAKTLIAIVYSEAFRDRENQEANARLIAAAPDMLEVLKRLDDDFASLFRTYPGIYTTGAGYVLQPRVLELRAVIVKAEKGAASTSVPLP